MPLTYFYGETVKQLEIILDKWKLSLEDYGLKICGGKNSSNDNCKTTKTCQVKLNGKWLDEAKIFKYLGSTRTSNGKIQHMKLAEELKIVQTVAYY